MRELTYKAEHDMDFDLLFTEESDVSTTGDLVILEAASEFSVARGVTREQARNIAGVFAKYYREVSLHDAHYQTYLQYKDHAKEPVINVYFESERDDIMRLYGFPVEEKPYEDQTDLDAEKWANYWGDYNQCGIHISY